jgi:HK97 family phage prohead protease
MVSSGRRPRVEPRKVSMKANRMTSETQVSGYASLFWTRDLNDDVTAAGAFGASLAKTGAGGVKMLCQHDADRPVGVWDEAFEDGRGLFVRGRILDATPEGRLCAALVRAGAMDGLSIGFRTTKARPDESGRLRVLTEVDLWEVSIVTFPMLPGARIDTVSLLPSREKVAA